MPDTDINNAVSTDVTSTITDYSVDSEITDGPTGVSEFRYQIEDWAENLGYYKNIPELATAVDAKANWTIGKGVETDDQTTLILDTIKGNGKDSFNTIIQNLVRVYTIAGDSFAEIIRTSEGMFMNLKPLDPSTIVIVSNAKGRIIRYEQVSKTKKVIHSFTPDQMFHLSRKRLADEVHGLSVVPSVKWIILARNEAMSDWKRVLHRNIDPLWIFHLDTDDTTKIAAFKTKMDTARAGGENMFIPKGAVVPEKVATADNSSLSPLAWIQQLNNYFFQAVNVPQIVIGNSQEFTDASGKIVYLAFEQSVKGEQLYIEEQVLHQINLEIRLTFQGSLQQDTVSDTTSEVEEEAQEPASQPNDTTAEAEGNT